MAEIKIAIENCNNISSGEIVLEEEKLNIKYGMNGKLTKTAFGMQRRWCLMKTADLLKRKYIKASEKSLRTLSAPPTAI